MGHVLWNVTARRCTAAGTPSRRPGETLGSLLPHLAPWMNRAALAICFASVSSNLDASNVGGCRLQLLVRAGREFARTRRRATMPTS